MARINDEWLVFPSTANRAIPTRKDTGLSDKEYAQFRSYGALPHARAWRSAEWLLAARTARLSMHPDPSAAQLGELRLLEREMGVTALARRAARIRWED